VTSSQKVFEKLSRNEEIVNFDIFRPLAEDENGDLDRKRMRHLVKLFRPSREGALSKLDFLKSVDT
jgi:hypothetical protein